jgi:hypothetical protein
MYDATRRRNYSPAGERFRKEHQRHRDWGLEQRHRKKLCDLYGSVEAAEAHFAERARAALAPKPPEPPAEHAECPAPPAEQAEHAEHAEQAEQSDWSAPPILRVEQARKFRLAEHARAGRVPRPAG